MRRMAINRGVLPDQCVHIGDSYENSNSTGLKWLGDGDLVEVDGVIVVNGCPEPVTQVAHAVGCTGWFLDCHQLLQFLCWKVRLKTALKHGAMRNRGERGPIVTLVWGGKARLPACIRSLVNGCIHAG